VDCCAHFGISHQRRHRADEDVEATVQLLEQLLPLASARGWSSVKALEAALAPVDRGGDLVFEINVEEILAELLIEKAGWHPGDESVEDAMARYGRQRRAEREAAYARMEPEHRAAHELKDALEWDERRASAWLPVLQALKASGCPEVADAWVEYGRRLQGPKRNAKRALAALCHALDLHLAASDVTRMAVDEAVTWVTTTCENANLPDELIEVYRAFGPRLAMLPPCGQCGDLTTSCLGGGACSRADLASRAAWAPFHVDLDADEDEDPAVVERRARAVLPLLAAERDLAPYVRLGSELSRRLVAWGRGDAAVAVWQEVVADCAGRDVPNLVEETDRFAEALATAKRYLDASIVVAPAVETARQQAQPELFWRVADHFASYLERTGRLDQAVSLWREAIKAGSDIPNTFDRLSLALERAGNPSAAVQVSEIGLARFSRVVRRYKYVQQIERRAERCRAKVRTAEA
jgi:tetratricopeptide (TPR) repeat protein